MESVDLRESPRTLRNLNNPFLAALFPKTRQDVLAATFLEPSGPGI